MAECDRLGREAFLDHYGYKPARAYVVVHLGREYDSKAIVGVAHRYVEGGGGTALRPSEFSGGEQTVGRRLRELGFDVRTEREPAWGRDELLLACAVVDEHGWEGPAADGAAVRELSGLLRRLELYPPGPGSASFRGPEEVARVCAEAARVRAGARAGGRSGGGLLGEVVRGFVDDPEAMRAAAREIREGALRGDFDNLPRVEEDDASAEWPSAVEGRLRLRLQYVRERSRPLRNAKVEWARRHGRPVACEVCGFDFGRRYGPRGDGYIEIHHVVPLHHIGESENTVEDLAMLCANCHRMIHAKQPWITVEELRALVRDG
ncbi:HNH endonuclease [Streptomonospora nanhaiensis]|uniref:HNH endonuclease n=1 Tax=Streptomonospora nanhaiensis TaxID=1323731 RepID=UPI001C38FEB8|nr:HNH endonuclease [Streptomonospora nanhaiensis]MBV2366848.1 HNH endonuclease [Streptomonospora nanhaiensis]